MTNTFRITISAVDKATAVVRSVKNSFAQITKPVADLKSVVSSFGKETGLDKVGKSIFHISDAASDLATKMSGVFPALAGGMSIAGIAELAGHWGELGAQLSKTAGNIGISTSKLQELSGAARRADVGPEVLQSSLISLGTTMENVLYDRGGDANVALQQMGIQFRNTAGGIQKGTPDIVSGLTQVADAIQKLNGNPNAQRTLLQTLGISGDMLPLLRRGSAGIQELTQAYQQTRGMISQGDIERADAFHESLINLGDALGGVGTRLIANIGFVTEFNNAMAKSIAGTGPNPFVEMGKKALDSDAGQIVQAAAGVPEFKAAAKFVGLDKVNTGPIATRAALQFIPGANLGADLLGLNGPSSDDASAAQAARQLSPLSASGASPAGIYINAPAPSGGGGRPPSVDEVTSAAAAMAPKMSIELIMKNAPAGMQARARLSDGKQVPVRVESSMPTTTMP